jgi:hypothetical protein
MSSLPGEETEQSNLDQMKSIASVSPVIQQSMHDFIKEIEPKIKLSKLQSVPCDVIRELELETCPLGYKVDLIKWCLNCGSCLSKHSFGKRAECCTVPSFSECQGLVTCRGGEGPVKHGMPKGISHFGPSCRHPCPKIGPICRKSDLAPVAF